MSSARSGRPSWVSVALLGALGTTLVAVGACQPDFAFDPAGWALPAVNALGSLAPRPWYLGAMLAGAALLAWQWWRIRPRGGRGGVRRPGWLLACWALPMLLAPPILSGDAGPYADSGYQLLHGSNVYTAGYAALGGPFASQVDPLWAGQGVAYPPLTLLVNAAVVAATGAHPYWSVIAMRVPALAGVALLGLSLARIARVRGKDASFSLWLGLLNPLLVVHFVGGAHNDALMAGVALAAIWLVVEFPSAWVRWLAAPVCVGLAMALKQQSGLAVLAVAGVPIVDELRRARVGRRLYLLGRRTAAVTAVALATFGLVTWASGLGLGWTKWLSSSSDAGTVAPFGMLSQFGGLWLASAGVDPAPFRRGVATASTLVLLAALAWIVVRWSDRPVHATGWAALALATLGMALHPWYVPFALAVLAIDRLTPRQRASLEALVLGFLAWNTVQSTVWYKVRL